MLVSLYYWLWSFTVLFKMIISIIHESFQSVIENFRYILHNPMFAAWFDNGPHRQRQQQCVVEVIGADLNPPPNKFDMWSDPDVVVVVKHGDNERSTQIEGNTFRPRFLWSAKMPLVKKKGFTFVVMENNVIKDDEMIGRAYINPEVVQDMIETENPKLLNIGDGIGHIKIRITKMPEYLSKHNNTKHLTPLDDQPDPALVAKKKKILEEQADGKQDAVKAGKGTDHTVKSKSRAFAIPSSNELDTSISSTASSTSSVLRQSLRESFLPNSNNSNTHRSSLQEPATSSHKQQNVTSSSSSGQEADSDSTTTMRSSRTRPQSQHHQLRKSLLGSIREMAFQIPDPDDETENDNGNSRTWNKEEEEADSAFVQEEHLPMITTKISTISENENEDNDGDDDDDDDDDKNVLPQPQDANKSLQTRPQLRKSFLGSIRELAFPYPEEEKKEEFLIDDDDGDYATATPIIASPQRTKSIRFSMVD